MGLPDSEQVLVEARDLTKLFSVRRSYADVVRFRQKKYIHAVNGIDLGIKSGEVFGLVGESGSGKTTTGLILAGVERPTEGRVFFDGVDIWQLNPSQLRGTRRRIQMIFQDPYDSLDPRFDVYHTLEEPLIIHKIGESKERRLDIVCKSLESVNMSPELLGRNPFELSGGQRQRVCVARALTLSPEFLILDEPVSMLDMSVRAGILDLLSDIKKRGNLTYLFISHDLAVTRYMTDRMSVMYLGAIAESGVTEEIIQNPMHPYTKALLSAVPDPLAQRQRVRIAAETPSLTNLPTGCKFHTRCPYAMDICNKVEPRLLSQSRTRLVACHLYG